MNTFFTDTIYTIVETPLKKPNTERELSRIIEKYIEYNTEALSTIGPINKTIFTDSEKQKVFKCLDIDSKDISKIIRSSEYVKKHWVILNKPFDLVMMCIIRYYAKTKNEKMAHTATLYYLLSRYPSYFFKYFKHGTNEAIMEYTINDMSNKFKIKTDGALLITLTNLVIVAYENYKDDLIRGDDKAYASLAMGINTRLNAVLKKIAIAYYDNHKNQNFLNKEIDNFEEEGYSESESNVYKIDTITNAVISNVISYGYNYKYIDVSARMNKISKNELKNYINNIIAKDIDNVRIVVGHIIYSYLIGGKKNSKQINSSDFVVYCMDIYKRSNTNDDNIIEVKKILDKWLNEAEIYKKTQRIATINDFRRSLYMFFVLTIQGQRI